jgi:hypothetical protein
LKLLVSLFAICSIYSTAFITDANAQDGWKQKVRPFVEKILGNDLTSKILGDGLDHWDIPEAPQLVKDATSTKRLPKETGKTEIPADKKQSFDYGFIMELYQATRGTKPNENDVARWMNALSQGGTRSGIFRALVLDSTYAGLEQYDAGITQETADFAIDFASRFFNQNITIDQLKTINFYSLKRILGERALDIVDRFIMTEREDDLYRWYAVISAEFARNYSQIWSNQVRSNQMAEYHYQWAKTVPWEHLKSELVIKLFFVLNHING